MSVSAVHRRAELPHLWALKAKDALEAAKQTDNPAEQQKILAIADEWLALAHGQAHEQLNGAISESAAND